ncbi:Ig-like domain-containing protein [Alcanivorax sp. DP30]|uniref:Ig-like domain-containing protein n=1 Tax=Alcanivorax sp. DP30 TaxID=2606217 RepID=UPI00136BD97E|nr:Ig-like domain-containing protein [Alcanivorax sp. DP30]MZR61410.1 hypothetical protein [Alcanivorax sp. DP30]
MRTKKLLATSRMLLLLPLLYACEEDPDVFIPPDPGNALIYAYPADGMVDLPTGSKMVLTFSSAINASQLGKPCTREGENYQGAICLVDSQGQQIDLSSATLTNGGKTLLFSMQSLREGEQYRLWLSSDIAKGVVNLNQQGPLLSFRTRQYNPLPNAVPEVLAINMEPAGVYLPVPTEQATFPFMDFAPVRLTFSEPLVQTTVRYGDTIIMEHLLRDEQGELTGQTELVDVNVLAERQYITLDPVEDLIGGETYRVSISGIQDFDDEAVVDVSYQFDPIQSKDKLTDANPPIRQLMKADPTLGDSGYPAISRLHGAPLNQFNLETVALGITRVDTKPVTLEGFLGRPAKFPYATPVVARAGQQLRITGIDPIKLGGEVNTGISTGDIIGTFVTDITGFMTPNPYRPKGFQPDDDFAPLHVYMDFDLAMHTVSPEGNGSINQNLMHIRAVGVVDVKDGALTFEVFRTMELDVFSGAAQVSADFALGVRADVDFPLDKTNQEPLILTGTFPSDGEPAAESAGNIILTFNEPVAAAGLEGITLNNLSAGTDVPIQVNRSGSVVVVTPLSPLAKGQDFLLDLGAGLTDMDMFAPSPLDLSFAEDATGGDGKLQFHTSSFAVAGGNPDAAAPILLGIYPGVGCALVDTDVQDGKSGRCAGGLQSDLLYSDFEYDMSRPIELSFNQPMDLTSMEAGAIAADGKSCKTGAVCLGQQVFGVWEAIPMSMQLNPLRLRAYPQPNVMQDGGNYRIVVNGSGSTFLSDASQGGRQLNTDPLNGVAGGDGGPNIIIDFMARADYGAIYATVLTRDYTDVNANGYLDEGEEVPAVFNYARANLRSVEGPVTGAQLTQDTAFTNAALPMAFLEKIPLDLTYIGMTRSGDNTWCGDEDADGEVFCFDAEGDTMIPVEINPEIVMGTNLTLTANVLGLVPLTLETGPLVLRFSPYKDNPDRPLLGFVVNEVGEEQVQFIARLDALMDAPDLEILGGLAVGDVQSKDISAFIKGPVKFLRNGQITLECSNTSAIAAGVNLSLNTGDFGALVPLPALVTAELGIDKDDFRIRVVNSPAKALLTTATELEAGAQ